MRRCKLNSTSVKLCKLQISLFPKQINYKDKEKRNKTLRTNITKT